jgi:hypothetical protein
LFCSPPSATLLVDSQGDSSGWNASFSGAVTAVHVVDVDLANSLLTITLDKTFGAVTADGEFPVGTLTLSQQASNANPVTRIVIQSESITNHTGTAVTDFKWVLAPQAAVDFNIPDSSGWGAGQFTSNWVNVHKLLATDFVIPNGGNMVFSSNLAVDVTLGRTPVTFTLKEYVTPEPTTLVLLCAGAMFFRRKNREKVA